MAAAMAAAVRASSARSSDQSLAGGAASAKAESPPPIAEPSSSRLGRRLQHVRQAATRSTRARATARATLCCACRTCAGVRDMLTREATLELAAAVIFGEAFWELIKSLSADAVAPLFNSLPGLTTCCWRLDLGAGFVLLVHGDNWQDGVGYSSAAEADLDGAIVIKYRLLWDAVLSFIIVMVTTYWLFFWLRKSARKAKAERLAERLAKRLAERGSSSAAAGASPPHSLPRQRGRGPLGRAEAGDALAAMLWTAGGGRAVAEVQGEGLPERLASADPPLAVHEALTVLLQHGFAVAAAAPLPTGEMLYTLCRQGGARAGQPADDDDEQQSLLRL